MFFLTGSPGRAAAARHHVGISAAVFMACVLTPLALAAQQPTPVRVGQTVNGTLSGSDPVMLSGMGPFRVHSLEARQGDRLIVTLRSGAFDSFLSIMRAVGGIHEVVARDDDSGGGSDARLRWTVPVAGTYFVVAQALNPEGAGGYTLSVETAPPARPVTPVAMSVGETRDGVLTEESSLLPEEPTDVFHDLYAFDARAGQELVVTLDSDDFDAFLAVGPLSGTTIDIAATDDDSGTGTNARVRFTVPQDGRYGIQVRGLGPSAIGRYRLSVSEAELPEPRALVRGRDFTATLHAEGIDQWTVEAASGERLRIRMSSDEFDTYLAVGRLDGTWFESIAENDDEEGAGTTDSLLEFTAPAAGHYVVRASAYGGGTGSYTIRVDTVR
jgi:hypothetical protein